MESVLNGPIQLAAEHITKADAILIGAGAGMGVDSGLPDFRGNEGFWQSYPPMKKLGLSFYDLADPMWFERDPARAWGFYGHRRNLYGCTKPHPGFQTLKKWVAKKILGGFVFTSNVDGHFQKAGFAEDRVLECHGSIEFTQCAIPCSGEIWGGGNDLIDVDKETFRARGDLPKCLACHEIARPNILMFGDSTWLEYRTRKQYENYRQWIETVPINKLAVIEFGAGKAVPTVRSECESQSRRFQTRLIRVNPREFQGSGVVSIELGALDAIQEIDRLVNF